MVGVTFGSDHQVTLGTALWPDEIDSAPVEKALNRVVDLAGCDSVLKLVSGTGGTQDPSGISRDQYLMAGSTIIYRSKRFHR